MRTTEKLSKQEFELGLKQFIGTEQYWEHMYPGAITLKLTDGCNFVRQEADSRWLFDAIAYFQFNRLIHPLPIQFWRLHFNEDKWLLECKPDEQWYIKNKYSIRESIVSAEFINKDFPLDPFEIWVVNRVAMLPSEY